MKHSEINTAASRSVIWFLSVHARITHTHTDVNIWASIVDGWEAQDASSDVETQDPHKDEHFSTPFRRLVRASPDGTQFRLWRQWTQPICILDFHPLTAHPRLQALSDRTVNARYRNLLRILTQCTSVIPHLLKMKDLVIWKMVSFARGIHFTGCQVCIL